MFCRNCQTIIPDDSLFCENCGAPTGLDPEKIDDSNLVPEEAVEYEVVTDEAPAHTSSVPVDPVWWEPPEEEEGPIDVEATAVEAEEPLFDDAPKAGTTARIFDTESGADEGIEAASAPDGSSDAVSWEESGDAVDSWPLHEDGGQADAAEAGWMEEGSAEEHSLDWETDSQTEIPETIETAEDADIPRATVLDALTDETEEASEPTDAAVWSDDPWAGDDWTADEGWEEAEEEEAEESFDAEEADKAADSDGFETDVPDSEATQDEAKDGGLHINVEELKQMAASAAAQARPYAGKAKDWLENLGKNVRTGTGWAADAAKEQFAQRREEYQERREERQQQRAQDRKEKELERRRQEKQRQEERERQEEEARRAKADVIQQPGFWYGDEMPEPTIVLEPAVKVGAKKEEEEGSTYAAEGAVTDAAADAVTDTAADGPADAPKLARGIDEAEYLTGETAGAQDAEAAAASDEYSAAETMLPDEEIEDKLADTARFDWSAQQLREAAAQAAAEKAAAEKAAEADAAAEDTEAAAAETDAQAETYAKTDATTDGVPADDAAGHVEHEAGQPLEEQPEGVSDLEDRGQDQPLDEASEGVPIVKPETTPDEPELYRIKDFGPAKVQKPKRDNRNLWKMLGIIAAIVVIIVVVGAVMVHQAHVRQLEEEAYQASLTQAHQLVEKEKYKKAEKAYLALIDERPEDTAPYLGLAQMYMEQQRYVDAKALIKRAVKATGDKEAFAQIKKDIKVLTSTKWKKAYKKVLEENESDIRKYEDYVTASVAVCDVNGDKKPELFFFTEEYYGYGKLHIYTTVDNKAKEVDYECQNRGTQYHDAFYDVNSDDSSYAIFNTSEDGRFIIYANVAHDGSSWDTTNEFELNLKGGCKQVRVMEGAIEATYDEDEADNSQYMQDGEDISYDKYAAEFKKNLEEVKDCILYNGSGGDQAVWDKITQDNVMCMSYDAMMVDLEAK